MKCFILSALLLLTLPSFAQSDLAPKPLFRDPIHDGAADPTLIYNRAKHEWWMFYTNRRADLANDDVKDVSWVHNTRLGIAVSRDRGAHWTYKGIASLPYGTADYTFWAPDIVYSGGLYHMYSAVVPGTFKDWNAAREIVHFTSPDLEKWTLIGKLDLGSDRVIDPSLIELPNHHWRMWFKDERDHSHLHMAESTDLTHWTLGPPAITDRSSEGPKVFQLGGKYWMITDAWRGLPVYSSDTTDTWTLQKGYLLSTFGTGEMDKALGHHCDVVVNGDRAWIFYFTALEGANAVPGLAHSAQRTVLQVAELKIKDGILTTDRDAPTHVDLGTR